MWPRIFKIPRIVSKWCVRLFGLICRRRSIRLILLVVCHRWTPVSAWRHLWAHEYNKEEKTCDDDETVLLSWMFLSLSPTHALYWHMLTEVCLLCVNSFCCFFKRKKNEKLFSFALLFILQMPVGCVCAMTVSSNLKWDFLLQNAVEKDHFLIQ